MQMGCCACGMGRGSAGLELNRICYQRGLRLLHCLRHFLLNVMKSCMVV